MSDDKTTSDKDYSDFFKKLGADFKNLEKLQAALTHSSTGAEWNYERLEFLGDRVLGLVIAEILYRTFKGEPEGDLAKRHAALVQGKTLAAMARDIDLGDVMELSDAERAAGGADNDNILSDGLEAVIGALYLDGGFEKCKAVVASLLGERVHIMTEPPQDPKTELQEWAQARALPLPAYEMVGRSGPDHEPLFEIEVSVEGVPSITATGTSRRKAEKAAASQMLNNLKSQNPE